MGHDELAESLAQSLSTEEWLTAHEVCLRGCEGRVDLAAVRIRNYKRKELRVYEVKATRSDFLVDIGRQKWRKYLDVAHRVYFATPAGLVRKDEIPRRAGLVVLGANGWQTVKSAGANEPVNFDADTVLSFLFAYSADQDRVRDLKERLVAEEGMTLHAVAKRIGGEIAARIAGNAPKIEREAAEITAEAYKHFGSRYQTLRAIRAAAALSKNVKVLSEIGDFLGAISKGIDARSSFAQEGMRDAVSEEREGQQEGAPGSGGARV